MVIYELSGIRLTFGEDLFLFAVMCVILRYASLHLFTRIKITGHLPEMLLYTLQGVGGMLD